MYEIQTKQCIYTDGGMRSLCNGKRYDVDIEVRSIFSTIYLCIYLFMNLFSAYSFVLCTDFTVVARKYQ